jgi:tetratricopeptide (TPR) repeat protein
MMNRPLSGVLLFLACGLIPVGCSPAPSNPVTGDQAQLSALAQPETQQEAGRQLRMGYDAFKRQELDLAMSSANEALRLDTNENPALTAKALVLRSLVYNLRKDHDRAVTEAIKAIQAKKDAPYAYFARARAYEWKEQYQKAADDLTQAIALTPVGPQQASFYEFRSKCYAVLGQEEKAREDERRARELGR